MHDTHVRAYEETQLLVAETLLPRRLARPISGAPVDQNDAHSGIVHLRLVFRAMAGRQSRA